MKYSMPAIIFHWLMVLLIFTLFALGWYMVDLPKGSPERSWFFALHKSIGLTTALIALLRLLWRLGHKPPKWPESLLHWQRKLADITHNLLYLLIFLQPVSGYISSSFSGYKTKVWGLPLPHWGWENPVLNELFTAFHAACSVLLLCLIILHVLAAIASLFAAHESVLKRMLP